MNKAQTKKKPSAEFTSVNKWMDHYNITTYRDEEFEELSKDADKFGTVLANSTIDRILQKKSNK